MERVYTVTEDKVKLDVGGQQAETDFPNFLAELGRVAPVHTGLIPPGLRSFSQLGEYTQVLLECPPGINLTYWGMYERDQSASLLQLAQPYRVILADFFKGQLQGARMFYSPVPITSAGQQLYHINLPNVNCRGYGGTGVGWLCLYHRNLVPANGSWGDKLQQVLERASGSEAYNDRNMSETDGARFYQEHRKSLKFLWDKMAWEAKSQKEGYEWTLDADLWIPILVPSVDDQTHHAQNGVPLTVGALLEGGAASYYTTRGGDASRKQHQLMRQGETPTGLLQTTFDAAFNAHNTNQYGVDARHESPTEVVRLSPSDGLACVKCRTPTLSRVGEKGNLKSLCDTCQEKNSYCHSCGQVKLTRWFATKTECQRCEKNTTKATTAG